jgi:dTDP-4-dehydrorhamnose reductase
MDGLELWGGHECTVNRVGGAFQDQTRLSGHHDRLDDLDRFAELGVAALRYPVLWERTAPDRPDALDFRWSDARLARMQALDIRPIVGLVHHGSGPRYTNLLDEAFAPGLANFARSVAQRYPHVRDWTPVNEPLTTARFSCLYGLWYPHVADEGLFWSALLNQIDGVRLSMREIRAVNPEARLIQPEDFGRTYATRPLAEQARYDNARRWMTWDLLCGRVVPDHPLWARLAGFGLGDRLRMIADDPCPPQVLGINHYLTSDRFLDHRCDAYPPDRCGGNDSTRYADVEAIRVLTPAPGGLEGALREVAARYDIPIAITECHNGCTREDQMRWFREAWEGAHDFQRRGGKIEAVTAWALLGSYDWNTLLTRRFGHYECGVFDVRSGRPRATAAANLLKNLTGGAGAASPASDGAGWWRRDVRLQHRPVFRSVDTPEPRPRWRTDPGPQRPILITGATGTLGKALARACEWRGLDYVLTSRAELDLGSPDTIAQALDAHEPWAVLNAAGFVRVDEAEADHAGCFAANAHGIAVLAEVCGRRGVRLVGFSSDLVFDGRGQRPYVESDLPAPLNVYGASKAAAERRALAVNPDALMIRTAAFFSPYDPHNFAVHVLRALAADLPVEAAEDLVASPTYVPDLVDAVLDLVIDGESGLWHLANSGAVTWAEFAILIAEAFGFDPRQIRPQPAARFGWAARRPTYAPLATIRGAIMPPLESAIGRFTSTLRAGDFLIDEMAPIHEGAQGAGAAALLRL